MRLSVGISYINLLYYNNTHTSEYPFEYDRIICIYYNFMESGKVRNNYVRSTTVVPNQCYYYNFIFGR